MNFIHFLNLKFSILDLRRGGPLLTSAGMLFPAFPGSHSPILFPYLVFSYCRSSPAFPPTKNQPKKIPKKQTPRRSRGYIRLNFWRLFHLIFVEVGQKPRVHMFSQEKWRIKNETKFYHLPVVLSSRYQQISFWLNWLKKVPDILYFPFYRILPYFQKILIIRI